MGKHKQLQAFRREARKNVAELIDEKKQEKGFQMQVMRSFIKPRPRWIPYWLWKRIGRIYLSDFDLLV